MVDAFLVRTTHLLFAALWAGSVFYVAFVAIPLARDGAFNTTAPLESIAGKLALITRISAAVLLLTGIYMAHQLYTVDTLVETINGQLVLVKVVLWLALAGLVEVGTSRLESGLEAKKLREPAADALTLYRAAAAVAVAAFVVSGAVGTNVLL